jgi:hypothetical protein
VTSGLAAAQQKVADSNEKDALVSLLEVSKQWVTLSMPNSRHNSQSSDSSSPSTRNIREDERKNTMRLLHDQASSLSL